MNSYRLGNRWVAVAFAMAGLLFLLTPASHAQAQENIANVNANSQDQGPDVSDMAPSPNDSQDPPTSVARVSYLDGSVSLQPGGTGDWGTAGLNRPITIGDKIWTDQDSRAELQAGEASIHLGSMTALSFLNLNQGIIQMRMAEGHLNFRVRELREGETYEVDTPNMAFTVTEAGAFRVDVNENGDYTTVTVIRGKGEVSAAGQSYPLTAGERGDISGTDQNVKYVPCTASEPDALDKWAQERDLKEDNSASARYVSRDTVGYSDLDDYGTWKQEPEVGNVWVPNNVPADWAPYSDGNWSYIAPWGWTWVDYAPWGFAPYHYGRWGYYGGSWGWCPGPIWAPPVYGPAFVGFVGGFSFGVGFGWGGGYGWFPLGWGEPYHPWYHCGPTYWNHINVYNTHFHNFNSFNARGMRNFNYRYARNDHAVTVASHSAFVGGQRINRSATHITAAGLRNARVENGISARPTNASYFGAANLRGHIARPSAGVQDRAVVARSTPARAASHLPVRTMNSSSFAEHRGSASTANVGRNPGTMQGANGARSEQRFNDRPPSSFARGGERNTSSVNTSGSRPGASPNGNNARSSPRTWNAQGNATDSGRAPQGFGSQNRANSTVNARSGFGDRPPWARGAEGSARNNSSFTSRGNTATPSRGNSVNRPSASFNGNGGNRSTSTFRSNANSDRPPSNYRYSAPNRGNTSAPRNYTPPSSRGYSSPSPRSYTSGPSYSAPRNNSAPRNYSAPRSTYSAPRGYSAPRSYSAPHSSGGSFGGSHSSPSFGGSHGGGGGSHAGGGGSSHGGGGGSHGGGRR
ncbi:MAG TPA: DUF6600 domain-containing protein [Candidatus Eisenbacteria bacterium]|nr:DUF6600 domain-containing protein [Candidatus Eisenbacteria bacterium]